jgi:hypothetical protein
MRRIATFVLLVIGAALIVAPIAWSMFGRTSDGARLVDDLRPIMQPAEVVQTAQNFQLFETLAADLGPVVTPENAKKFRAYEQALGAMQLETPKLVPGLSRALGTTPAQTQALLTAQYPAILSGLQALPKMQRDLGGVVAVLEKDAQPFSTQGRPALTQLGTLVAAVQRNPDNYASVDALPRLSLFPWFLLVPGIVIVLLSGFLLATERRAAGSASGAVLAAP